MSSTRPASDAVARLHAIVARALAADGVEGAPLAVGLSGGRDSVVLLDALASVTDAGRALVALHVHHGLSPHADAWARFCADLCAARDIPLVTHKVTVAPPPQTSLEDAARRLRYAALAAAARDAGARFVALAHHRDDQAETLLLQLLRGAGPHGLAGMPTLRADARGVAWWRPLLACPRAAIDAYAAARALAYVDDESNALPRHRRNALRHVVFPALAEAGFPAAGATLARAAQHQADALRLADDVAREDARTAMDGATLDRMVLRALAPHRARNLLRWYLEAHGRAPPSTGRLADMLTQLTAARDDAQVRIAHDGCELGVHRGRIHLHAPPPPPFVQRWMGEPALALPHGTLRFAAGAATAGGGALAAEHVFRAPLEVRAPRGGERLQLAVNRPRRALKVMLYEAGMPAWDRRALPILVAGDAVVAVPGIGVALEAQAACGAPGFVLTWHPAPI